MTRRVEWRGKQVMARMRKAQRWGVNKVMSECVIGAKNNHPWENRTGTLEGSIRIVDFATDHPRGVRGLWGSADVNYAIHLELGTRHMQPFPYLRPAADAVYPTLGAAIAHAWERGL